LTKKNRATVAWARLKVVTALLKAQLKASKGGYVLHQLSVTAVILVRRAAGASNPGGRMRAMQNSHIYMDQNFHCRAFATTKSLNT
jgi:hypothetical protein